MSRRPSGKAANRTRNSRDRTAAAGIAPAGGQPTGEAIKVELSTGVDGWPAHNRFDVVLRGQITSNAPLNSFSIRNPAGQELAGIQFGQAEEQEVVNSGRR